MLPRLHGRSRPMPILTLVGLLMLAAAARPARVAAQDPLTLLKQKAEQVKKAAEAARKQATKTRAKTDSIKADVDSTKQNVVATKAAAQDAARNLTGGTGSSSPTAPAASAPSAAPTPSSAATKASGAGVPASPTAQPAPSIKLSGGSAKIEEQVLLKGEPGMQFWISPKGQHLAAVALRGSRMVMVYDGVDGPKFDEIKGFENASRVVFSEDGSRYAYVGRIGQEWVVMVDGKELARGAPWNQSTGSPTIGRLGFTPGDKHVWFTTDGIDSQTSAYRLYIDGKPGPVSEDAIIPLFSTTGERHAYVRTGRNAAGRAQQLIIDGKPSPYPGGDPQFTADGLHVFTKRPTGGPTGGTDILVDGTPFMRAAGAELHMAPVGSGVIGVVSTPFVGNRRTVFLTIGNKRVPGSDCQGPGIDRVYFSPDAKHWAVRCQDSNSAHWVMADGKKGRDYQSVGSRILFTADGRPVYQASMNGKNFLVVGDEESDAYQTIRGEWEWLYDPEQRLKTEAAPAVISGNRVGYIAWTGPAAGRNNVVVVDGKPIQAVGGSDVLFSPDGSRFAYVTGIAEKDVVVDEGAPLGPPAAREATEGKRRPFVFSPDGKHIAYAALPEPINESRAVALDGKLIPTQTSSNFNIMFTPDSKHLLWVGIALGKPRQLLYVDGKPVSEFDATSSLQNEAQVWSSMGDDGVLTIVVQDAGMIKRLRVTPGM